MEHCQEKFPMYLYYNRGISIALLRNNGREYRNYSRAFQRNVVLEIVSELFTLSVYEVSMTG
jgi:hypothetical protein